MLSATIAEHDSQIVSAWLQQAQDLAVVSTDPHGRIVAWLAGAQLIFGYTPQEAIGQHIAFLFTKEDQDRGYPAYDLHVAACDRYADESRWHVRKDHTRIWASGSVTAVRSDSGEILGFVKVMRDTTDQRTKSARIQQVICNLLQNAIKYTHIGGSIWVKAIREGHEVVCRIQDTGIGIFPPVLPNLFDLFSQAQGSEDMRAGGIGVGLAVVRQIV